MAPKQLKGLRVHEVSGVDYAANLRTFLVTKSAGRPQGRVPATKGDADMAKNGNVMAFLKGLMGMLEGGGDLPGGQEHESAGESLETVCCALNDAAEAVLEAGDDPAAQKAATVSLIETFGKALASPELLEVAGITKAGRKISGANMKQLGMLKDALDKLLADNAMPATKAKKKPAKGAPPAGGEPDGDEDEPDGDEPDGEEDETMGKNGDAIAALTKRLDAQDAELAKAKTDLKEAQDALKKAEDLRLDADFLAKAREIGPVPGQTFEQTAKALRKMHEVDPELAKQHEAQLKASADLAKSSGLLKEQGSGARGSNASATEVFMAKAGERAEKDKITVAKAMELVAKEEPGVYQAYALEQAPRRR